MAQTIHCEEHGLCIAQCELCVDEKHEREIAELERKLAVARECIAWYADGAHWTVEWVEGSFGDYGSRARRALEEIK